MKWMNKGHELDQKAEKIVKRFRKCGKIYVFGAGLLGAELRPELKYFGCFAGYIDNSAEKQKKGADGCQVLSFQEYLARRDYGLIVIAADIKNIPSIEKQIKDKGLEKDVDYYIWEEFQKDIFPIIAVYYYDKSYVELCQISLTERCTLQCRKCAHACPMADNKRQDLSYDEVCKSADSFFRVVDVIKEFVLIGGEPLLYKHLAEVIDYIGKRYRSKMMIFSITTNGTLRPSEKVLELCRKYNVLFRISDYSVTLPYLKCRYDSLLKLLNQWGIEYSATSQEMEWMDYGFDYVNWNVSEAELMGIFDRCGTKCHEVRGNRYYFCVMARSVSENMQFGIGEDDYLDLDGLSEDNYKKELLEFNAGYSDKGYLEMCRHCNGADAINYPIPPAEQIESSNF